MIKRRTFIVGAGLAAVGAAAHMLTRGSDYRAAADALWSHRPFAEGPELVYLVHYATLAANSHNAQPWRFRATPEGISLRPDPGRMLPVADPDNHHLYASLGCAAENLMLAAGAAGRSCTVAFSAGGDGRVDVALGQGAGRRDPLFESIVERQCTRSDYDARPIDSAARASLQAAARVEGCDLMLIDDRAKIEQVLELILAANEMQVADPAFAAELLSWLRFNAGAALATCDGLYAACAGNPTLPDWLGPILFDAFFKPAAENERYARQVRSSAGLALFIGERDDRAHWVQAGRSYQRFALQATALGIRHAHLNQPLEVKTVRPQLAALLGLGNRRIDLMVRYGRGPAMPRSLRRPVRDVIDTA